MSRSIWNQRDCNNGFIAHQIELQVKLTCRYQQEIKIKVKFLNCTFKTLKIINRRKKTFNNPVKIERG